MKNALEVWSGEFVFDAALSDLYSQAQTLKAGSSCHLLWKQHVVPRFGRLSEYADDYGSVEFDLVWLVHFENTATYRHLMRNQFVALCGSGHLCVWGGRTEMENDVRNSLDSVDPPKDRHNFEHICGSDRAFAALTDNGSLVMWGSTSQR